MCSVPGFCSAALSDTKSFKLVAEHRLSACPADKSNYECIFKVGDTSQKEKRLLN